ncbi:hypothetical protein MKW98_006193 [Papaver atlanticum]|uniref:SHSP domain-containing protein n=1 Tax=Papaver atlanticum TaxID=357466 RepID=A0AAD4TGS7_9MAGN|nr:hypothetical protein MKW98_006193 [Papaver atlanticum]
MAAAPIEMGNSFVLLVDLEGKNIWHDEIKIMVEGDKTVIIRYDGGGSNKFDWHQERFDLPLNAYLDAISAVSHNGTLLVSVGKIIPSNTERTINVVKGEPES